jgi:hypothetical protein
LSFTNSIVQGLRGVNQELTGLDKFLDVVTKNGLLKESLTYAQEAIQNGLTPFLEYEKPFENLRESEFDIRRYFEKAKRGDLEAKSKIAKFVITIINTSYRGVPRVLGASDLFFGGVVKNAYIPIVLQEKLYKEGYRGKELRKKVLEQLVANEIEIENAKEKANEIRLKEDITYKMNQEGDKVYWTILDKGKVVTSKVFKTLKFDTKEEAEQYALENVVSSGTQYKRDVRYFLNKKIGDEVIKTASKIAQRDLLSGKTEAGAAVVDRILGGLNRKADAMQKFFSAAAKSRNSVEWKAVYDMLKDGEYKDSAVVVADKFIAGMNNALAIFSKYLGHLVAFRRVAINLARKTSNYFGLGYIRYYRARNNKGLSGVEYETEITQVERDKILAEAILGTIAVYAMSNAIKQVLSSAFGVDDDEDEKDKRKLIAETYKKKQKKEMPKEILDILVNLKKGDVIGSLEFLSPATRKFYNRTGIIKENSIFEGVDENGNYSFRSVLGDPKYALALMLATTSNYDMLEDEKEKNGWSKLGYTLYQPLSTFADMSIGQGLGKQLSSNKSFEDKAKAIVQTTFLDAFESLNPDIVKKPLQFFDQKLRPTESLFDFIEDADTFSGGLKDYTLNKVLPVYGAVYSATKATQAYGMFGEELYRLPAQEQGMFAKTMASYLFSDKNLSEKAMYDWLGANGYRSIWKAPSEIPVITENGDVKEVSKKQAELYGITAGRKSFAELTRRMGDLQDIRLKEGEDAFKREVNAIMSRNFRWTYYEGEGILTSDEIAKRYKIMDEDLELENKLSPYKEKAEQEMEKILNITPEEKELIKKLKTTDDVLTYAKTFKKEELDEKLLRLFTINAISSADYNYVKKVLAD